MLEKFLSFFIAVNMCILLCLFGVYITNPNFLDGKQEKISEENEQVLEVITPEPQVTSFPDQSSRKEEDNISTEIPEDDFFKQLCLITYAESGLEEEIGQIAVAATVINRIESSTFPDTLNGVVNQKGAFSSVHNGEIYIMCAEPYLLGYEDVPEGTKEAVRKAINGEDPTEQLLREEASRLGLSEDEFGKGGSLFFYNEKACSEYQIQARECVQVKIKIGNHTFYKVWG